MMRARASDVRLVEPVPIEDDYCTALAQIEDLGGCARFVLYTDQACYETGTRIFAVKRKIVLPYGAIRPGIDLAFRFLVRRGTNLSLRLVK